jgi:hypothetical protein
MASKTHMIEGRDKEKDDEKKRKRETHGDMELAS